MNQPRSINPALSRPGQPPGQPQPQHPQQQPQQQQPPQQQPQGSSGLVGPDGRPLQQDLIPLRLNPDGVAIPTTSMNPHDLVNMLGGQVPGSMVLTWLEVSYALSQRDAQIAWLERRLTEVEAGRPSITFEQFIAEMQAEMQKQYEAQHGAPPQQPPPPAGQPGG